MKQRILTSSIIILFVLSLPAFALAKKPVQKLKDPVKNFTEYNTRFSEILDLGYAAVPDLVELLEEDTADDEIEAKRQWGAKVTAMNILSELKAKNALAVLEDLLENSDDLSAINNSARTIGRIGGNQAYKILEGVFFNTQAFRYSYNDDRKRAVIAALGLCGNKKAVPLLLDALENPNNDQGIRIYAAGSLGLLGNTEGLGLVNDAAESDDSQVKLAAIRALGLIGSTESIESLVDKTGGSHVKYIHRNAAKLSLVQIESEQLTGKEKAEYIKEQLIKNPKKTGYVQWGTMKLKNMKSQSAKKALKNLSEQDAPEFSVLSHAAKARLKTMD